MIGANSSKEYGYVFRDRHPERTDVYRRFDEMSAAARSSLTCRRNVAYGAHPREVFDLFAAGAGAPLVVFVHGGYWQSLDKDRYSFVGSALVRRGFSVALPNYPLAPETRIDAIVARIGACVQAILRNLATPPAFWIASGHSAGGHLAATLAMRSLTAGAPLAGCVTISGIFDVEPLAETSLNAALGLDRERAARISPIRWPVPHCRLAAVVGTDETQEFRDQSRRFSSYWSGSGQHAELVPMHGKNHYTILCDLLEERSEIAEQIVRMAEAFRKETGRGRH
ncbi:alpha/beta hydrolase [Mesorhizobium sp. B2-4-6]|uniref:alpha/beta hydrolase n=1 Tax=Mesorhizobium sp. B2-4-6 TaxID=2589943 RepID=UPI0011260CCA|nr:alpha/beta hydrolase [Mesorhizobium sp. B2-4-6]TPL36015.1 alpha/beta hydrolase [Mesorhizobium sp. B2-4-6]